MRCRAMRVVRGYRSELKARLTGAVGEGLDAAVEAVAAAIEHAGLGTRLLGALGEQLAGALGLVHAGEALQVLLRPVRGGRGPAAHVGDELGLHAAVRAEHRQPRAVGRAAHLGAHAPPAAQALLLLGLDGHARLPTFRATYSSR